MGQKKKEEIPMWVRTGHSRPVTRRDFLTHGIIPFAAAVTMPSWLNLLLPQTANAAPLCAAAAGNMIPFVTLNLAGGAAIMSNFVPHDQGGQMLPSYSIRGLGKTPPIDREFGNVPFAGAVNGVLISKFLQGIRETAPTALPKTAFIALCSPSGDDRSSNKFSVDGMLVKAGSLGSMFPTIGSEDTSTGVSSLAAVIAPPKPIRVNSLSNLTESIGYAGALTNLKPNQKNKLARLINTLSDSQSRKLASITDGQKMKDVLDCAGIKNESLLQSGTDSLDLRKDAAAGADLSTVWQVNAGTGANDANLVKGSIVYNTIKSQATSGGITLGGYDYHDGNRTNGDAKDLEAGQTAGRILETAAKLNRPVFLLITTDGAVSSVESDSPDSAWTGDQGEASGMYLMYYNPNGRPATTGFQIGQFTKGQVADDKSIIGSNTEATAAAVFANYLATNNRLDAFASIVPSGILDSANLNKVIKFG
jgi:hypothetical protein